jgi:hypothetical protein
MPIVWARELFRNCVEDLKEIKARPMIRNPGSHGQLHMLWLRRRYESVSGAFKGLLQVNA